MAKKTEPKVTMRALQQMGVEGESVEVGARFQVPPEEANYLELYGRAERVIRGRPRGSTNAPAETVEA